MTEHWKGKKILILGIGSYPKGSGISATLFAARSGADVLATDLRCDADLKRGIAQFKKFKNVRFRLGKHHLEDIRWADIIIRNPRVRPTSREMVFASRLGKRIESDISIFLKRCPCSVVGITGTRGKSTSSTLVAAMLKASKRRTWLGGNIRVSPLTFMSRVKKTDVVVLELSSWQLEVTGSSGISPHVACITNFMRDHLNSYEGMDDYGEAKAQIFRHQGPEDILVLNMDDVFCRSKLRVAPGQMLFFARRRSKGVDAWIGRDALWMKEEKRIISLIPLRSVKVFGEHNLLNMLAAALTARAAGATLAGIKKALREFKGIQDREEIVAVKKGITFINDTTATTPDGTIAAVHAFAPRFQTLRFIVGGADKGLDFTQLAAELAKFNVDIAVLPGSAGAKFMRALDQKNIPYTATKGLREAFRYLMLQATRGDVVILSPGCASFGAFQNEFDRGEQFRCLVRGIDVKRRE